jgi:hypothetical protein
VPPARSAFALEGADHGKRRSILDRPAGVLTFQFDKQPAAADVEPGDLKERGVANEIKHALRTLGASGDRRGGGQRYHRPRRDLQCRGSHRRFATVGEETNPHAAHPE